MSETAAPYQVRGSPLALPEKRWQAQVEKLAALLGWRAYHTYDSRRSAAGFPDLVLVGRGRALFVELKTDTGRLTPAQRAWLGLLGQCPGVEVYCWRPAEVDDVLAILQGDAATRERGRVALRAELG